MRTKYVYIQLERENIVVLPKGSTRPSISKKEGILF